MLKRKSHDSVEPRRLLKKSPKKVKNELRLVNQRKMNTIFIGGLVGFVVLSVVAIASNLIGSTSTKQTATAKTTITYGKDNVDYRLQQFLDGYVSVYFTVSDDSETRKMEEEELNSYYAVPTQKGLSDDFQPMSLVMARLQTIKDNIATYQVTYDTGREEMSRVTVKFSIPYGETDSGYYVSGLPWIQAVDDLKADDIDTNKTLNLTAADGYSDIESEKLDEFINLFFINYTTSQKNLDLISDGLKAVTGVGFKSVDYVYYKEVDKAMTAYVQVTFDVAGSTHSENFTLKLIQKNGDFYVSHLEHTIPYNYAD